MLKHYLIGFVVLFASLGLGEAVYRISFSDFDGVRDRLPLEALCGILLGGLATKVARNADENENQATAKLRRIGEKSDRIRHALGAISPVAHPTRNQQYIRIIREELDHIEKALAEVLSPTSS